MNRKDGYYWVKWKEISEWSICEYDSLTGTFKFTNGAIVYSDKCFQIDENVISRSENEVGKKVIVNDGETIGEIVYKTELYVIKDEDGSEWAFAEHDNWVIFDVQDIDNIEEYKL